MLVESQHLETLLFSLALLCGDVIPIADMLIMSSRDIYDVM